MEENEKLYNDTRRRILYLKDNGKLTDLQVTFLLDLARKKLGLKVLNSSIYL